MVKGNGVKIMIFATDLDRTMIYSQEFLDGVNKDLVTSVEDIVLD